MGLGLVACRLPTLATPVTLRPPLVATPTIAVRMEEDSAESTPIWPDPAATPPPFAPSSSPTPPPRDPGWETVRPGLERRRSRRFDALDFQIDALYLLRLDPDLFRFDLGYHPGQPQRLEQWQADTGALIVVNGGFFTPEYTATGLIILNGVPGGVSYEGFGGMLTLIEGHPDLRGLAQEPYDPAEKFDAALQSFPLLVHTGGQLGYTRPSEQRARRTVIAQDQAGRFILLVADRSQFTLPALSRYLLESDLALDIALNLDGGPSSGLLLAESAEIVPAYVPLPSVILIYAR